MPTTTTTTITIPGFLLPLSFPNLHKHSNQTRKTSFLPYHPIPTCPHHPPRIIHPHYQMRCTELSHPPTTPSTTPQPSLPSKPTRHPLLRPRTLLLPLLLITTLYLSRTTLPKTLLPKISTFIQTQGPLRGSLILFTTHLLSVISCFPANAGLQIAAGGLLGPTLAFFIMWSSKVLAAVIALLLGRVIFRKRVVEIMEVVNHGDGGIVRDGRLWGFVKRPGAKRILKVMERVSDGQDAWKLVLLLRLSPVPGFMLNYLSSLTKVPVGAYCWATAVGTLPSVLNWVLIGAATREGARVVGGGGGGGGVGLEGVGGLGGMGSLVRFGVIGMGFVVMVLVTRMAKRIIGQVEKEMKLEDDEKLEQQRIADVGA